MFQVPRGGDITSQCPNCRVMVVRPNDKIESEEEKEEELEIPTDKEEELEYPIKKGKILIVKRSLNIQSVEDEQQWENIFHTRCHVQCKVCSMIIDRELHQRCE
ncbi:hypothetical protein J1N35_022562 [Gossypium stocksii]|uniref:Uncharacterized protein n=1 Tax=Gossypium stocksii TaxID=47602 RepID=A0A9D3VHE8_9ROSI|nr:hypothetical protein J1N35_022562 [Gossypium stocksii]